MLSNRGKIQVFFQVFLNTFPVNELTNYFTNHKDGDRLFLPQYYCADNLEFDCMST